jgi:uncharacterized protein
MKKLGIGIIILVLLFGIFIFLKKDIARKEKVKEKPLLKYAYVNLKKTRLESSTITLGKILEENENYISQMFYYDVRATIDGERRSKKVSGLINIPKKDGEYPVIVMSRGFVDPKIYSTGTGTKRAGEFFAQNNFITLAPDFLGYGESDKPSQNSMEERFQTYTTALILLSSLSNLDAGLDASYSGKIRADVSKVGIWGHSNGGQIAISVLEITGKEYPTVLWAPVSKPFPYSILYFTDEFEDHGKALRKVVADFENDYNIELYSPSNFYSWINAPIEIHQGTADDAVPIKWSDNLVTDLTKLNKNVEYFTYSGADHNLTPGWGIAVQRSLDFYKKYLK